jgi:hypothetical protein
MVVVSFPQAFAALAGICSGGVLGCFMTSEFESKVRGIKEDIDPLSRFGALSVLKIIANSTVFIIILGCLVLVIALTIFHWAGIESLNENLRAVFGICFLASAGAGKYFRYLYWRYKSNLR